MKTSALLGSGQNISSQVGVPSDGVSANNCGIVQMPTAIPIDVANLEAISCGFKHSVFLVNGEVFACGDNLSGQIGCEQRRLESPTKITISEAKVRSVACGQYYTSYLTTDGNMLICGWRNPGAPLTVSFDKPAVYVSAGFDAPVVIDEDGSLYIFESDYRKTPTKISLSVPLFDAAKGSDFVIAVDINGVAYGSGALNSGGSELAAIASLDGLRISRVFANYGNAGALTSDGKVYMRDSTGSFVKLDALDSVTVVEMDIGQDYSVYVTDKGVMYSCGKNTYGELMLGRAGEQGVPMTQGPFARVKIAYVKCGAHHTFAVVNSAALAHAGAAFFHTKNI